MVNPEIIVLLWYDRLQCEEQKHSDAGGRAVINLLQILNEWVRDRCRC